MADMEAILSAYGPNWLSRLQTYFLAVNEGSGHSVVMEVCVIFNVRRFRKERNTKLARPSHASSLTYAVCLFFAFTIRGPSKSLIPTLMRGGRTPR